MSRIFPARGLYRIVRANTMELSETESRNYKWKLSIAYVISAGVFCTTLIIMNNENDADQKDKFGDYDSSHWTLRSMGVKEATIFKLDGLDFKNVKREEFDLKQLRLQEAEREKLSAQKKLEDPSNQ